MRNLCCVFLERCVAVRIPVYVECEPHFIIRRFLPGVRRRNCAVPASFFAAWRVALNFCHSDEAGETWPAGFSRCNARNWPFNCRNEKGTFIFGVTKRV